MSEFSRGRVLTGKFLLGMVGVVDVRDIANAIDWLIPGVHYYKEDEEHKVALTIDDAPSPSTSEILDVLALYGAHATFFITTKGISGREELMKRIVEGEHELGNHMVDDIPSHSLGEDQFKQQLREAHRALMPYQTPRWFRPASGVYNKTMIDEARAMGYSVALGDVFPFDTHVPSPEKCAAYIVAHTRGGSILILHDGATRGVRAAAALRAVLPALQERGLTTGTLSMLFG